MDAEDLEKFGTSIERKLQQARHCIEEAEGVLRRGELSVHAVGDLDQGIRLLQMCLKELVGERRR